MNRLVARLGTVIAVASTVVTLAAAPAPAQATAAVAVSETIAYGPEPFQVLDLQLPDSGAFPGPRPLIIYVHSGGWITGERTAVPEAALVQVARGYALATIDYRLAAVDADGRTVTSFPGVIWDVKRAIRFAKSKIGRAHV